MDAKHNLDYHPNVDALVPAPTTMIETSTPKPIL